MSNDQPVFSFELNEALYFEKGQEVAEMRGISLDPEISIQSFNEYISIRGVIELRGEYQKVASVGEVEPPMDFDDYHSKRYVERVVDMEEGGSEFSHRFPVEISVPTYRVSDINDVTVYIESFDYEIPDQSQLKLCSTIEIHGISDQTEEPREEVEDNPAQEEETELMQREADESFQFEIKQEKDLVDETTAIKPGNIPALTSETKEETSEEARWKFKKQSQTLTEFFESLNSKENDDYQSPEIVDNPSGTYADPVESPEVYDSVESRSEAVEDVSYLSDMFRNSEEEKFSQMRLCIVQEKDTIETIAERYKIPTLQLIKQNHLDEDYDISQGQLLYIPNKK